MPDGRQINATEEEFLQTNMRVTNHLFKNKEVISHNDMLDIKRDLYIALLHY
jgi:hypothetical protein